MKLFVNFPHVNIKTKCNHFVACCVNVLTGISTILYTPIQLLVPFGIKKKRVQTWGFELISLVSHWYKIW